MNKDNISALLTGVGVVALIVGFAIYFNNPEINKSSVGNSDQGITSDPNSNNGISGVGLSIDKSQFKKAPEFTGITSYINTNATKLSDLKGKVVLVDFWTYSCINCIRTLPYLVDWNQKYSDKGLVIVGVHSPEFEFEKNIDNVKQAVTRFGIKYPVLLDNDHGTWNAFQNSYWPRKYLVDSEGYIRYDHIGEGGYVETENAIKNLLSERSNQQGVEISNINQTKLTVPEGQSVDFSQIKTPELYFGYQYARDQLGNIEGFNPDKTVNYTIPTSNLKPNVIYLQGLWKNNPDSMELVGPDGKIILSYSSKSVNIVAGGKGEIIVKEDGKNTQTNNPFKGNDLDTEGKLNINGQRLYNIADHGDYGNHHIEINAKGSGFKLYTFTFG
ncbi:MAG TPA: thioredoxin family protein [Nitrososphaeraceae archaeon]|nr:thioredoxin family protein [Nitrososphaeraceae archaeon]